MGDSLWNQHDSLGHKHRIHLWFLNKQSIQRVKLDFKLTTKRDAEGHGNKVITKHKQMTSVSCCATSLPLWPRTWLTPLNSHFAPEVIASFYKCCCWQRSCWLADRRTNKHRLIEKMTDKQPTKNQSTTCHWAFIIYPLQHPDEERVESQKWCLKTGENC